MMCSRKNCKSPADRTPQIVFLFKNDGKDWRLAAVMDLPTCITCREITVLTDILPDGGDGILKSLLAFRPMAKHLKTTLEWIPLDHPDYKILRGMGPS